MEGKDNSDEIKALRRYIVRQMNMVEQECISLEDSAREICTQLDEKTASKIMDITYLLCREKKRRMKAIIRSLVDE